nr:Hypothetical protein CBG19842 [Haemonchus contortus]
MPYDGKRILTGPPPGPFAESYVPHPNLRRSMISLNADSGYLTSPSDSERMRMRGSRLSLNHLDFEHQQQLVFPPDLKTMKKLEKMEKKQQKLLKKIGGRPMPPPPPQAMFIQPRPMPPPPQYSRAMSFDDLHRAHIAAFDGRFREQFRNESRSQIPLERQLARSSLSTTTTSGKAVHRGGSMTSSPVTSISDSHTGDRWTSSPLRRDVRDDLSPMSGTSAQLGSMTRNSDCNKTDNKPKSVEIKVQRTERVERREQYDTKDWINNNNNNNNYAMPKLQPAFGSRSSLATSQARGESSDIDFSWIREEENKLRKERENAKRLPECYFGLDPPKLDDTPLSSQSRDEKENHRRIGNVRSTAAAFENKLRRENQEQALKSRSSTHLENRQTEYSTRREVGPMARRLQRMQREAEVANRNYNEPDGSRQRWRSSMAF